MRLAGRAVSAIALAAATGAAAQQPEPRYDALVRAFQTDALRVVMLLQVVADVQAERTVAGANGFQVANARLGINGRLDGGWSYELISALTATPAVLDSRISHTAAPSLTIDAGRFKVPFSRERLTNAGAIDFVNRAQVTATLSPGRQVGAQARGLGWNGHVEYALGVFNGNSLASGNDDNEVMAVGRVAFWPTGDPSTAPGDHRFEIAVNAGVSRDAAAPIGALIPSFEGDRRLVGVDFRRRAGRLLLAGEAITALLDPAAGSAAQPTGWHATAGWHLRPATQVLVRWDAFRPDGLGPDADLLVLGWNRWPTQASEVQVNWVVDLNDAAPKRHQLLVNLQLAF